MKCDVCEEKATIFFTQLIQGKKKKVNLCQSCADEKGVTDPTGFALADMLDDAGLVSSLRLLTTGTLPDQAIDKYAETLLSRSSPAPLSDAILLAGFDAANLRSTPYARALDITGESVLTLIEADPHAQTGSREVLSDADWVRLQGICGP